MKPSSFSSRPNHVIEAVAGMASAEDFRGRRTCASRTTKALMSTNTRFYSLLRPLFGRRLRFKPPDQTWFSRYMRDQHLHARDEMLFFLRHLTIEGDCPDIDSPEVGIWESVKLHHLRLWCFSNTIHRTASVCRRINTAYLVTIEIRYSWLVPREQCQTYAWRLLLIRSAATLVRLRLLGVQDKEDNSEADFNSAMPTYHRLKYIYLSQIKGVWTDGHSVISRIVAQAPNCAALQLRTLGTIGNTSTRVLKAVGPRLRALTVEKEHVSNAVGQLCPHLTRLTIPPSHHPSYTLSGLPAPLKTLNLRFEPNPESIASLIRELTYTRLPNVERINVYGWTSAPALANNAWRLSNAEYGQKFRQLKRVYQERGTQFNLVEEISSFERQGLGDRFHCLAHPTPDDL